MKRKAFILIWVLFQLSIQAQNVSLYKQFGGPIDFTIIGNTLNIQENGFFTPCVITTSSSAALQLNIEDEVLGAYLYWAGSGTGDFDVVLNETPITATRTFSDDLNEQLVFFSAFYDITEQVLATGNNTYTLSELDLTGIIDQYCPNGTNFGGWSILVVYRNENLPLNQVNIYDGLQHVPDNLSINLTNIEVIDNDGAKIGFIAWEGDAFLSVNESLFINGNLIGNPPLNPSNNAFNGTNSFTNSNQLYNMDLDVYDVQNNIQIGDTEALIELTSGQDFVMINTVITKFNSQLPDPSIAIENVTITNCNEGIGTIDVVVSNNNATKALPENTSITIYANDILLATIYTTNEIDINAQQSYSIPIVIPEAVLFNFNFTAIVNEIDPVLEINPDNNKDILDYSYPQAPEIESPIDLLECNIGFNTANFDLSESYNFLKDQVENDDAILFFPTIEDLEADINAINPNVLYTNSSNPQIIYIKAVNQTTGCFSIGEFSLSVYNCPPTVPDGFSPNGDGINETFNITGLYDIFLDFNLEIYNRNGSLVYRGNQNIDKWNGRLKNTKELVPIGIYFYILQLNDPNYQAIQGSVYVSR
ncbi:hypothetical protein KH5_23100 [Urechidicola sp. KH5]